jgi:hypothetical protein
MRRTRLHRRHLPDRRQGLSESLHDAVITESILNRIVSNAEIVQLDGPNMRRHTAAATTGAELAAPPSARVGTPLPGIHTGYRINPCRINPPPLRRSSA